VGCAVTGAGGTGGWLVWLKAPDAVIVMAIATAGIVIAIRENLDMMLSEVPRSVPIERLFRIGERRFSRPQLPQRKIVERCCMKATYLQYTPGKTRDVRRI
jgi:hypothetical protein